MDPCHLSNSPRLYQNKPRTRIQLENSSNPASYIHTRPYSILNSWTNAPNLIKYEAITNTHLRIIKTYSIQKPHTPFPYPIPIPHTSYPIPLLKPTRNPRQDIISNIGFYHNNLSRGNISWMVPVRQGDSWHGDRERNGYKKIKRCHIFQV